VNISLLTWSWIC